MVKDYYKTLGVNKTDSEEVIKKAYKKLALKFHPDKSDNEEERIVHEEKFKEINEAYSVLGDSDKKKQFDSGGGSPFAQKQDFGGGDFSDIFEELFRSRGFGGRQSQQDNDLHHNLTITFDQSAFGCVKEITLKKDIQCSKCSGSGSEDNKFNKCNECNGNGRVEVEQRTPFGNIRRVIECHNCEGTGKIPQNRCSSCKGGGIITKKVKTRIKTPQGIDDGQTIRITNAGNVSKNGQSGDLFLTINVKPHNIFKRQGFDVVMDLEITFSQAALGREVMVPTLTDKIKIKITKGTESGSILRLRDKGIPYLDNPEYKGDQFVNIIVKTPKRLTKAQAKLFEKLEQLDE